MKSSIIGSALAVLLAWSVPAISQPQIPKAEPKTPPRWSAALDAYGGLGLMFAGELESHVLGGGLTRLRYRYFQLGGFAEITGYTSSRVRHMGGVAGVFVPYRNFADLEGWLGFGARRYVNSDRSFGPGGYEVSIPALSLRLGVSDRTGGTLGGRLGGQLLATADLGRENLSWEVEPSKRNPEGSSGTRRVGGVSVVLALVAGFDVAPQPPARKRARPPVQGPLP